MTKEDLKVNDIISVNYWHYYGTAVDFYKVSKICAKTVNLIPLKNTYIYHSWGGDESTSIPGEEITECKKRYSIRFIDGVAKVGKHEAAKWDGQSVRTYNYS